MSTEPLHPLLAELNLSYNREMHKFVRKVRVYLSRVQHRLRRLDLKLKALQNYHLSHFGERLGVKPKTPCSKTFARSDRAAAINRAAELTQSETKRLGRTITIVVMHRCDNPQCTALEHMQYGTPSDNVRDMHIKGRAGHKCTSKKTVNYRLNRVIELHAYWELRLNTVVRVWRALAPYRERRPKSKLRRSI